MPFNQRTVVIAGTNGTLGAATGRQIYKNTDLTFPASLVSVMAALTTTATVGTRAPAFDIKDASGDILWRGTTASTQAASLTQKYQAGAGAMPAALAGGVVTMGVPAPCIIPPGGTVNLLDTANIDVNDSVTLSFVVIEQPGG